MTDSSDFFFFLSFQKTCNLGAVLKKTVCLMCSHRSRDDERISKAASTPAKLPEDVPLPKAKESAVAREDKQLPPLPGQCLTSGR